MIGKFWTGAFVGWMALGVIINALIWLGPEKPCDTPEETPTETTVEYIPISIDPLPESLQVTQELEEQAECLALNVYHEARGEGETGMRAVMHVTRNRVLHADYPDTYCEVVFQPYQFSWVYQKMRAGDFETLREIREMALDFVTVPHRLFPEDPTAGATHYHTRALGSSLWGYDVLVVIGNHVFFDHGYHTI